MALKVIMLRHELERKKKELADLREKDSEFETREAEIASAIDEAQTEEEREAVAAEVDAFDADKTAHDESVATLTREIEEMESELAEEERNIPKPKTPENAKNERSAPDMHITTNIRALPMNQRAFDAIPYEQRNAILAQEDVKNFLNELRSMKGQTRAISGADLTIPVVFLDLIAENMFRYSKLMNRVRIRNVRGQTRQTIAGVVPEAVWTEMCGNLNDLTFTFNQVTLDGYKVAGIIPVCNALLEDSDIALASWIIEMLSESIGLAKDKAILYGKGSAYNMPLGIVTRLAQTQAPENYPAAAPAWVDLHTSNIQTISADLTGAAFWSALTLAAGNTFTRYSRGRQFWAMNSKTYSLLKSKVITFTATGDLAANVFGVLPIIDGDIDILEFMPDGDIVGGYGDLYLWAQRANMVIGMDETGYVNRLKDETVFFGKERADGMPVIPGAFVAINIAGVAPTTAVTFAGDDANTVSGIMLPATATVTVGATAPIGAVLTPYGVEGTITWASGTTANATVDANGVVTGVKAGTSVITATCNGYSATCTVTVA